MFGRLREMGLAEHERYHGATLTEEGRTEALRLLRRHRLIETFLSECLGYSWEEVHEEAESLEHSVRTPSQSGWPLFWGTPPKILTAIPSRRQTEP